MNWMYALSQKKSTERKAINERNGTLEHLLPEMLLHTLLSMSTRKLALLLFVAEDVWIPNSSVKLVIPWLTGMIVKFASKIQIK